MIDIHPPQHAPMTKREFFVYLFIIVLGILIAIEQTVEALHHRHEREALIEGFHRECSDNLQVFDYDLDVIRQGIAWERASLAVLRDARPQGGFITVTMPQPPAVNDLRAPVSGPWQEPAARSTSCQKTSPKSSTASMAKASIGTTSYGLPATPSSA
jgi:hypothetical protein